MDYIPPTNRAFELMQEGTTVEFSCEEGYTIMDHGPVICENGEYVGELSTCVGMFEKLYFYFLYSENDFPCILLIIMTVSNRGVELIQCNLIVLYRFTSRLRKLRPCLKLS